MDDMTEFSKEFLDLCRSVQGKRARVVIDHILKHGQISTEEIENVYGYGHPPRAVRDVKERGIPIERFTITGSNGRKIAAYRFGEVSQFRFRRFAGRTGLVKRIKEELIQKYGCHCFIYLEEMEPQELQIDHRVPFEIAGEVMDVRPDDFMLLCGSANRAKSWSCEHCDNWKRKRPDVCVSCYWAHPENYTHIATRQVRRVDLIWQGEATEEYERLKQEAKNRKTDIPALVKEIVARVLAENQSRNRS